MGGVPQRAVLPHSPLPIGRYRVIFWKQKYIPNVTPQNTLIAKKCPHNNHIEPFRPHVRNLLLNYYSHLHIPMPITKAEWYTYIRVAGVPAATAGAAGVRGGVGRGGPRPDGGTCRRKVAEAALLRAGRRPRVTRTWSRLLQWLQTVVTRERHPRGCSRWSGESVCRRKLS